MTTKQVTKTTKRMKPTETSTYRASMKLDKLMKKLGLTHHDYEKFPVEVTRAVEAVRAAYLKDNPNALQAAE